jgi:hypothetical protein
LKPSKTEKAASFLEKKRLLPEKTKPPASGARGLYLLFLFLKDTEQQTP